MSLFEAYNNCDIELDNCNSNTLKDGWYLFNIELGDKIAVKFMKLYSLSSSASTSTYAYLQCY